MRELCRWWLPWGGPAHGFCVALSNCVLWHQTQISGRKCWTIWPGGTLMHSVPCFLELEVWSLIPHNDLWALLLTAGPAPLTAVVGLLASICTLLET